MTLDEALARIAALEREGAHITRAAKDWGCDDGDVVTFINLLALRVRELEREVARLKDALANHAVQCPQCQVAALKAARLHEHDFGPESDTWEDRGFPPPRCKHEWGINGCQKCGQPAMPRG